jgi:hypothetical protein
VNSGLSEKGLTTLFAEKKIKNEIAKAPLTGFKM